MESGAEIEIGPVGDVEDTIFVAVGKSVEKSKTMLFWVLHNFSGKRVCLLHVHQPENTYVSISKKLSANRFKQEAVRASHEHERKNMLKLLNQYLIILAEKGVRGYKLWIEMENIEKGIVEIIARKNIRWLVMGAAADKYYSKKMAGLKSKKAVFVCQQAPLSCHIWFACKGYLIYTRGSRQDETQMDTSPTLLLMDTDAESNYSVNLRSESVIYKQKSFGKRTNPYHDCFHWVRYDNFCSHLEGVKNLFPIRSTRRVMLLQYHGNTEEDADDWVGMSRSSSSPRLLDSKGSKNGEFGILLSTLCLTDEVQEEGSISPLVQKVQDVHQLDEKDLGLPAKGSYNRLEQVVTYANNSKRTAFEELIEIKKAEDDSIEVNEAETLTTEDMNEMKKLEELLARRKEEVERMENQQDELVKELQMVQDQRSVLESQMADLNSSAKELEEKIISAVGLLISIKQKRDELQVEHRNAVREINELGGSIQEETCRSQFLSFSFMEINEATNDFDPSWKIGEGSSGSVYKGVLRHMHVAIRMLPFYGSQNHSEFQHEVEVSCRVRHPNLVIFIGTCPELRSLVYEYLPNGSLEDRLTCRNRTPPLPWQSRIRIATEICSALIFLHSNSPSIVHGNLKPTKVLLDRNFVCKLSDLDISRLIPPGENRTKTSQKVNSPYMDPEFLETGNCTPEMDVFAFGVILLRLLTGRPAIGVVQDIKCALENEVFNAVLDFAAGEWPLEQAKQLAYLALRCCEKSPFDRPDLASEVLSVLEPMMVSASATCAASQPHRRIPSHFICPILQEVMQDPQIAADGFTYEADAIKGWLHGHDTSPMTNLKLDDCNLLPNYALLYAIQEWQLRS